MSVFPAQWSMPDLISSVSDSPQDVKDFLSQFTGEDAPLAASILTQLSTRTVLLRGLRGESLLSPSLREVKQQAIEEQASLENILNLMLARYDIKGRRILNDTIEEVATAIITRALTVILKLP